jgi:uncharacterized protein YndB with AHSA1/START domain
MATIVRRSAATEVQMPYSFVLTATIPASPREVYDAWLDSISHSEMTGGEATMSDQVGAEVSAWDGYISGRNLELVPGERIVQSWRTSEFGDEHEDSTITVVLQSLGDGTLLTLEHSNVPDEQRSYEEEGWQSNYFEPMVAYFIERKQKPVRAAPKKAAKTASKAKRAVRAPVKRAAPQTKASSRKGKTKAGRKAVPARNRGKKAKPPARKSARGRRG